MTVFALLFALPAVAQDATALVDTALINAARAQVGVTTHYDPAYVSPDVPITGHYRLGPGPVAQLIKLGR